jgi:hypothetical protein
VRLTGYIQFRGQSPGSRNDGIEMRMIFLIVTNGRPRSISGIAGVSATLHLSEDRVRVRPTNPIRRQLGRSGPDNHPAVNNIREGVGDDSPSCI